VPTAAGFFVQLRERGANEHDQVSQPDGFGVGMSVFALIGALMLFLRQ
jgi:hypothetical protein